MDTDVNAISAWIEEQQQRFFGKYRGLVESVDDPEGLGRIKARVPELFHDKISPWCLPCSPMAGTNYGWVSLPKLGDGVWIEFEAGDLSRPIWSGFWWAKNEIPTGEESERRGLWTPAGHLISFDDKKSEIEIRHSEGGRILIGANEIEVSVAGQKMTINSSGFNFNNGSLTVT